MPSPFPGVDPFIEAQRSWPDFHSRFMNCWCEAISAQLPENYLARLEERVEIVDDPYACDGPRRRQPDIVVTQTDPSTKRSTSSSSTGLLEPVTLPYAIEEEHRQSYIEIVHGPDRAVVTVLELLSPTNKEGNGFHAYLAKRRELLRQAIHLVELDLLLSGRRLTFAKPLPPGDFFAFVTRANRRNFSDVYSWTVRDSIPVVPVPLVPPDADLLIEMQPIANLAYERGYYHRFLKYGDEYDLPVNPPTKQWIDQIARSQT
jgi:hypothetical protein